MTFTIHKEFIKQIPKTDLHVHLDGSIRLGSMIEMAKSRKIPLPSYTVEGLQELVFKSAYSDLMDYLKGFAHTVAVLQDPEALEQTAYELAEDSAQEGIRYLEVRFAPQLHVSNTMTLEDVLGSVNRGLERYQREFNLKDTVISGQEPPFYYGLICCAMRMFNEHFSSYYRDLYRLHPYFAEDTLRVLASQELAMAVIKARDEHGLPIVGFDLAGSEDGYPAEKHKTAFEIAHTHFLKKTVHAGEAYGPESIFQAITGLHADRIGHGFHLYSEHLLSPLVENTKKYVEDLAQYIADRRITLEVCLTSNMQTMPELKNLGEHSLRRFLDNDLSITLCTDNRTVSQTTLTREIMLAVDTFDISPRKLKDVVIYGFKRSFFPGSYSEKRRYVRQIIDYYEFLEDLESKKSGNQAE